jgi:hypothetical protein
MDDPPIGIFHVGDRVMVSVPSEVVAHTVGIPRLILDAIRRAHPIMTIKGVVHDNRLAPASGFRMGSPTGTICYRLEEDPFHVLWPEWALERFESEVLVI